MLLLSLLPLPQAVADEPEWREPWQRTLVSWLKDVKPADVDTQHTPIDVTKLTGDELHRNYYLAKGYSPTLPIVKEAVSQDAATFLWRGGLWRGDEKADQPSFKPYGLKDGQLWLPAYPTTPCHLAWAYTWDRPWNPYHGDKHVARRAAIIAIADLLMQRESVYYYNSGETERSQSRSDVHPGIEGFSLTFNAFTASRVIDALPADVRAAWREGLVWYARRIAGARPFGPENMQLAVPVAFHYAYLATDDPYMRELSQRWMDMLLREHYDEAGYIRDGGSPDASYNGISIHRLAEYYSITGSERMLEVLTQINTLKRHTTLPEPNPEAAGRNAWLSPSHFNFRSQDGFANDQYGGREVQFAVDVPNAAPFLRRHWQRDLTLDTLRQWVKRADSQPFKRYRGPFRWGGRVHNWGKVLTLPYLLYHQDEDKLAALVKSGAQLAVRDEQRYTRELGGEFFVVRRPTYAAIVYAGPAKRGDNGLTNYGNMLDREGGYLNGFAGGGLSAFWTPEAGSLLLGRMTAFEAYERKTKTLPNDDYLIPGWRDWLNNHIIGQTRDGKILTSARTPAPEPTFDPEQATLAITGVMPNELPKQGRITEANVRYQRDYRFEDDRVEVHVSVTSDQSLTLRSLYETLPVRVADDTTLSLRLDDGRTVALGDQPVEDVRAIVLRRSTGGAEVRLSEPRTVAPLGVKVLSRQRTRVHGRAVHIALPTRLNAKTPVSLGYSVAPLGEPQAQSAAAAADRAP